MHVLGVRRLALCAHRIPSNGAPVVAVSAELDALVAACKTCAADPHAAKSTQRLASTLGAWAPTVSAGPQPPAPPPTPPPALLFNGDFSTGDYSQYSGLEYDSKAPLTDSFQVVTGAQYPQGHAGQFTLKQGYSPFGWKESCEAEHTVSDTVQGSRFFYGWHCTLPSGTVAPYGWLLLAQWYAQNFNYFVGPPPLSIDGGSSTGYLFNVNTGQAKLDANGKPNGSYATNARLNFPADTIYDGQTRRYIFDIAWSKAADGHLRILDVAGNQLAALEGIPTLRFDPGHNGGAAEPIGEVKVGGYRNSRCNADSSGNIFGPGGAHTPGTCYLGQTGTQPDTVIRCGFWVGDSLASVQAHFA